METIDLAEYQRLASKRSKFGNRKVKAEGYTFDSDAEYRRYLDLKLLQQEKIIKQLAVHPPFILQEGFRDRSGKWQRAITYKADFAYFTPTGHYIVEDTKGKRTDVFQIKLKLFLKRYPGIDLRIIDV